MTASEQSSNVIYITEEHRVEWTHEATKDLLKLYDEKCDMLDSGIIGTQKRLWELVSKDMTKKNYFYTAAQCENKWKSLKRNYRTKLEKGDKFSGQKRSCPFENEITEILSKRPNESIVRLSSQGSSIKKDDHDFYSLNLNDPPGFCEEDKSKIKLIEDYSEVPMQSTESYILQESGQLVEELSELRKVISKNYRMTSQILQQSSDLQSKIVQYFENSAQRECQRLELKEAKIEQQNEVVKQMKIQNNLLQKIVEKLG